MLHARNWTWAAAIFHHICILWLKKQRTKQPDVVVACFAVGDHDGAPGRNQGDAGVWARVTRSCIWIDGRRDELCELQLLWVCPCMDIPRRPAHQR